MVKLGKWQYATKEAQKRPLAEILSACQCRSDKPNENIPATSYKYKHIRTHLYSAIFHICEPRADILYNSPPWHL